MSGQSANGRGLHFADLVEESFDEAAFLWRRWEDLLGTHAQDLAGVSFWAEERLLGSMEGVAVAGEAAFETAIAPALASDERWRLTVAGYVAATSGPGPAREAFLAMIGAAHGDRLAALRRVVEVAAAPESDLLGEVERRLLRGGADQRAALSTIRSFHHLPPGREIEGLLVDAAPERRAIALRAARFLPAERATAAVEDALGDADPIALQAAVESGVVLGSRAAWARCLELARKRGPGAGPALLLAALLAPLRDPPAALAAFGDEGLRRDALFAAGFAGTLEAADACMDVMRAGDGGERLAAEAFCAITGLDLEAEDLLEPAPPEPAQPIPFEEDDLDADLVPRPDDLLPRARVDGVARWWASHRAQLTPGVRYLGGRPVGLAALQGVLERGPMRRRPAAALELAARTQGRYLVATRAFTAVQRRQMRAFAAVAASLPRAATPLAGLISAA
jgi:uncharacterized protein (TIGR02270 family)